MTVLRTFSNKPGNKFMEALRGNSLCSEQNREDFLQRADDFEIISFIESKKTKGVTVRNLSFVCMSSLALMIILAGCQQRQLCSWSTPWQREEDHGGCEPHRDLQVLGSGWKSVVRSCQGSHHGTSRGRHRSGREASCSSAGPGTTCR